MVSDYQFGKGAGGALFHGDATFITSKTGRIQQVVEGGERIATLRPHDGLLALSLEGAKRLHAFFPYVRLRVVLSDEAVPFVSRGKSAFAKHTIDVDPDIRSYQEVLLVDKDDELVGTGKSILSSDEMLHFNRGVAVDVRQGREERSTFPGR